MRIKQSDGRFHHAGAICHFPFCMYSGIRIDLHLIGYGINRTGLARVPVELRRGEPNTPLAFRRRDACHLKQQAGHGKMTVLSGQNTKDTISRIADHDTSILLIVRRRTGQNFNPAIMT